MKSKSIRQSVSLSIGSLVLSAVSLLIIAGLFFYELTHHATMRAYLLAALILVLCGASLFYMPLSISVNDKYLSIHRPLRIKRIPLSEIKDVRLCPPTMAARRISGSGGWFGYWGWFRESDIGKYFAYYGRSSDCFLVTLRNGRLYMLGCNNPLSIANFISAHIS